MFLEVAKSVALPRREANIRLMACLEPMRFIRIGSEDTQAQSKYGARGTKPYAADRAISGNIAPANKGGNLR
jgi:hypothetical protein